MTVLVEEDAQAHTYIVFGTETGQSQPLDASDAGPGNSKSAVVGYVSRIISVLDSRRHCIDQWLESCRKHRSTLVRPDM